MKRRTLGALKKAAKGARKKTNGKGAGVNQAKRKKFLASGML